MIKKTVLSMLVLAALAGGPFATAGYAQQYNGRPPADGHWGNGGPPPDGNWGGGRHQPPPPPPPGKHHHHNEAGIIAGGVAAGILGGVLGGALANQQPSYAPPPPPPPRCWFEDRPVHNQYDDGWHRERVRICN